MSIFSHIHRLLCRHCRHSKQLQCAYKGKKACKKTAGENNAAAATASAEHHQQTASMHPPRNAHYNDRAARRALRRAKEDLERELAKFPYDDEDDVDDEDAGEVHQWQLELEQAAHEDERMMPLDFLAELSGESQKTDVEPDFDFTPARRRHSLTETAELPAAVPAELPTNIHWTDSTDSTDSTSIGVALTTAGRVRTPPHARPFSLPPTCTPYPPLGKARACDNLRQLARKSIGSPMQRESFYDLAAASSSTTSISSTLSTGTATVQHMTPSVPTLITIKPARRRTGPALLNASAVPQCLEVGRHPSYRDSAARAHAVRTRQSLAPALLPTLPQVRPLQITPAWVPRPFVLASSTTQTAIAPPTRKWTRYSDLAQYSRPPSITPAAPIPAPIRPEPRSWSRYAQQETERKEQAKREKREARMREVKELIESRIAGGHAPTTFDEILVRPPMPTLRRSPTSVAYAPSAGAAAQFLLSASSSSSSPTTTYDSLEGRRLLHALRLLLGVSAAWSPAQTLVFVLEHARTRSLAVSRGADTIQRMNVLSWTGVLRFIGGPKEFERVARWLHSREALFTGKTGVRSLLLRKSTKRVYVENDSRSNSSRSTDSICIPTMLSQWAIENNPRRRYHQGWTGAGRSRLSACVLA